MPSQKDRPRYATKAELALRYSLSERTIEKWTQQRKIPFVRLSARCVRYDIAALDAMMEENTVPVGGTGRKAVSDAA